MKEQDTSDDMPNFQIDIFVEMDGSPSEEDKHSDCDDSGQEIDDFIKAEKSKNTMKKTRLDWQKFEYFCKEMTNGEFNIGKVPVPELYKLPERQLALLPTACSKCFSLEVIHRQPAPPPNVRGLITTSYFSDLCFSRQART